MTPSEPPAGEPPSGPRWERPPEGPPPPGGWARPPAGPPQGKQRSRGRIWGCVGALAAVVVIVVIVVVLVVVAANDDTDHPPSDDVRITSCTVDSATRQATARVEIHNHSSKASTYGVSVEFVAANGTRVSEGGTLSSTVAPGQTVRTEVGGVDRVAQKVTCKVTDVTRVAS